MTFSGLRVSAFIAAIVAITAVCQAQTDVQKLADQARALPPEFAADLLFRLPPSAELLESVGSLAAAVHNPVQVDDVVGWTDTDSWSAARAAALKLDTLSIQCRVVKQMLPIDPQRARQMFLEIALPAMEQPKCDAALASDPAIYYDTARELADRGLLSLEAPLRALSSALQLPAAARAIRQLRCTNEQRQFLVDIYAGRLAEISDSGRAVGFALSGLHLPDEIVHLAESSAPDGLLAAYRKFLVLHASREQCADSKMQPAIDSFNDRLRWGGYLAAQDLPRITEEESKPSSLGGRARVDRYWRTAEAKRLLSGIRHLRFGDGRNPLPPEQKATDAWQTEAKALLTSLEGWKTDSFHERAILYSSLLELLPPGSLRDTAAQSAIGFLADSNMKSSSPLEWLVELNGLINLKQAEIAKAMLASKDPVILLYGTLSYSK
jgi:hypothetical protein